MKRFAMIMIIILCIGFSLQANDQLESEYNDIVKLIIDSDNLDFNKISIVNMPTLKLYSFSSVELDYVLLGPCVQKIEAYAFLDCKINNLIIMNPEIEISNNSFYIFSDEELDYEPQLGPGRLIANAPIDFIKLILLNDTD